MSNMVLNMFCDFIYYVASYGSGLVSAGFSYQPELSEECLLLLSK